MHNVEKCSLTATREINYAILSHIITMLKIECSNGGSDTFPSHLLFMSYLFGT